MVLFFHDPPSKESNQTLTMTLPIITPSSLPNDESSFSLNPPTSSEPILRELSDEAIQILIQGIREKNNKIEEVPIGIRNMGAWSFSKYKTLKKCPFQYYLKYILKYKLPSNIQIQQDPLSANVGKAAHAILENVVVGMDLDRAFKKIKKEYVDGKVLTSAEWADKVDILYYNISLFKEKIDSFHLRSPIKRILTELRIAVTTSYQSTGFFAEDAWIRGVVDLILMLECLDIVILDHKTGGGEGSVSVYREQLDWYKVLFHFGIQSIAGAQTGVHFIGAGEVKMDNYSVAKEIENNLKNSLEMGLEGAIDALIEKGFFKHVRGPYCKWCEYDSLGCKSGELKPLELSTKKWIQIHVESN